MFRQRNLLPSFPVVDDFEKKLFPLKATRSLEIPRTPDPQTHYHTPQDMQPLISFVSRFLYQVSSSPPPPPLFLFFKNFFFFFFFPFIFFYLGLCVPENFSTKIIESFQKSVCYFVIGLLIYKV